MPAIVHACHLFVDSLEEDFERGLEAIGEEREGGDRRHRESLLDGGHVRARERRSERRLRETRVDASPPELAPDGDAQRGAPPTALMFMNT
jgi:hypothetical protein